MAASGRSRALRRNPLLQSLEQRLDVLTRTLDTADIAEKSIDIVKEIKELHGILRSLREGEPPTEPQKLVVVWGGAPEAASGRLRRPAASERETRRVGTPAQPPERIHAAG